jgi:hypothetical protein
MTSATSDKGQTAVATPTRTGTTLTPIETSKFAEQIYESQAQWEGLDITSYKIVISLYENFANNIRTQREVTVNNGQIVSSSCVSDKCPAFVLANVYTVDDLFAVAKGSTLSPGLYSDGYNLCVKDLNFDETYGFPKSMTIDCPNAYDEDHSFQVISFEILK